MRKAIAAVVIGAAIAAASVPAAGANGGGCPSGDGWALFPAGGLIDGIDVGNFHDQNGDGLVCVRANKGQTTKNAFLSFTVKDNTNPA